MGARDGSGHVLVVGPASWNTLVRLDALPEPRSQTLFAGGHHDGLGGTSAGKAVTLAALGVDVHLRTLVGDDEQGARVRAALDHPRIRLDAVPAAGGRTERHVNLMAADGGRVSLYLELPSPAVDPDAAAGLEGAAGAVVDLAAHGLPVLAAARAAGVPVWCDVHDDDGTAPFQRPFADGADVLLVSDARLDDPAAYLRARVAGGARLAVCSRGARGALALDAGGFWEVPAAPVDAVVDTNGAGDAFLAGLLAAELAGLGTPAALAHASAAGASAVATESLGAPHATARTVAALASRVDVRRA
ncbi:carbohydrate kinase family protein [Cellulomonas hominis]|uniref:carbohydrate kinase family protein n=1 Tax=Cellulomonas hominis TaxID=156981 RepID=UPI001BA2D1DF|nr:carbohydrate kinase family protein [Cellulomonas hominis]VTR77115.1 Acarbose 7(IV)-phosphotransferase [Cellulomonas hominis]